MDYRDDDREEYGNPFTFECEECGHPWKLHGDKYGCQYERGDRWVDWGQGDRLVAMGPCGCKASPSTDGCTTRGRREQSESGASSLDSRPPLTCMDWLRSIQWLMSTKST